MQEADATDAHLVSARGTARPWESDMNCFRIVMVAVVLALCGVTAEAGIFFNRKPKPNPAERVPQLITALRTEQDERKRSAAAEELRNFDAVANPDIIAVLVESALRDPQPSVRIAAIQSLGKLRPVNSRAGWALEQAVADPVMRVQIQARGTLVQYRMAGYRSGTSEPPPQRYPRTDEPPLAPPLENETRAVPRLPAQPSNVKPVAQPPSGPMPSGAMGAMPAGQPQTPLVPAAAPNLEKPPAPASAPAPTDGPELIAPQ
jgi:hypothetical protein